MGIRVCPGMKPGPRDKQVWFGATFGDKMEILSGLKAGDRVVIKPPKGLKDGLRIKVAEQ